MKNRPWYVDEKRVVVMLVKANAQRKNPCPVTARVIARLYASIDGKV